MAKKTVRDRRIGHGHKQQPQQTERLPQSLWRPLHFGSEHNNTQFGASNDSAARPSEWSCVCVCATVSVAHCRLPSSVRQLCAAAALDAEANLSALAQAEGEFSATVGCQQRMQSALTTAVGIASI